MQHDAKADCRMQKCTSTRTASDQSGVAIARRHKDEPKSVPNVALSFATVLASSFWTSRFTTVFQFHQNESCDVSTAVTAVEGLLEKTAEATPHSMPWAARSSTCVEARSPTSLVDGNLCALPSDADKHRARAKGLDDGIVQWICRWNRQETPGCTNQAADFGTNKKCAVQKYKAGRQDNSKAGGTRRRPPPPPPSSAAAPPPPPPPLLLLPPPPPPMTRRHTPSLVQIVVLSLLCPATTMTMKTAPYVSQRRTTKL